MSGTSLRSVDSEQTAGTIYPGVPMRWANVASRTIYFGHQSVGRDVMAGLSRLNEDRGLALRVVQTDNPGSLTGPAFVHFMAGNNRDYASKNAALLRLLEARHRENEAIVLLKYCYVDINNGRDADSVFAAYCEMAETIQFEHPDVTLVHTTIPLTTVESLIRARSRQLLGRPTLRRAAIARHRYNELVRAEFAGNQPIFDLARIEATRSNGTLATFMARDSLIEILAPENTWDGGHLSTRCQLATAAALLDVLADVIVGSSARLR
jgi:hypothetical protein